MIYFREKWYLQPWEILYCTAPVLNIQLIKAIFVLGMEKLSSRRLSVVNVGFRRSLLSQPLIENIGKESHCLGN
jgi:hypothetical protein